MTESIYMSLLNFLWSCFFVKVYKKIFLFFLCSIFVFLVAFCRSNGIYLYPIWGVIFFWSVFKSDKKNTKALAYSFLFWNLLWCFLNFASTKTFFFGNVYRIKTVSKNSSSELSGNSEIKIYNYNSHVDVFMDEDYSKDIHSKKAS